MHGESQDPTNMEQTNRDGAKGFQSHIQGGSNYFGENHIYNLVPPTPDGNRAQNWATPHNIPISQTEHFVGRDRELEQLQQLFQQHRVIAITDATGKGGVGKTELAIQYCLRHLEEYPGGICWLFPRKSDIGIQIVEFARVQFPNFFIPNDISLINQITFCWRRWYEGQVLLVIDNVTETDYIQIQGHLPLNLPQFKVLFTTREQVRGAVPLTLKPLESSSALELLQALMGKGWMSERATFAEELCMSVGCLPLSLHGVSGLLKRGGALC